MNDDRNLGSEPKSRGFAVPILFGVVLALVGANAITFVWLDGVKQEVAALRHAMVSEITKVQETATLGNSTSRQDLEKLRAELDAARKLTASATGQVRQEAQKHADEVARRLQEESARQQAQVASQLNEVREAANATNAKVSDVSTDIGNVRSEVASAKSELDKTISELKSVRGDQGVQSGLIATNARELAALRSLGDRNYYEFRIAKSKQFQKVGNVQVQLTKADVKKNKYTVQLIADDKKVEKKDKNTNEPVQFYLAGSRQPVELVVNEITKDQIAGYLATPKTLQARN